MNALIRCEDADFADFSLREGDIAVPVEIFRSVAAAEADLLVYPEFLPQAEAFLRLHGGDPFSQTAAAFWLDTLNGQMHDKGFDPSPDGAVLIREFSVGLPGSVRIETVLPGTVLVESDEECAHFVNATTHTLEPEDGHPCAVHIRDGVIAAYAAENDGENEDGVEIHVECAPQYRRCGYASSCAALLTQSLLARGKNVLYRCRAQNAASAGVAAKVGFVQTGLRLSFVYYRSNRL